MAAGASSIPVRENGQKVAYDWFNPLRTALIALEGFLGTGFISETSFTIANNQGAAANVTGLVLDKASFKSGKVTAEIRRRTDSNELIAVGTFAMIYRAGTDSWELAGEEWCGDAHGVTLSITPAGQVQYTSTNVSGSSYSGTMKFKAESFSA
jgi:hypothetical protein